MSKIEYYFCEVISLKEGGYKFGQEEDTNAYTFNSDEDVISSLTSKLGGGLDYIETAKVHHQEFDEDVHTIIFRDNKENKLIGVYTFNKAAKA